MSLSYKLKLPVDFILAIFTSIGHKKLKSIIDIFIFIFSVFSSQIVLIFVQLEKENNFKKSKVHKNKTNFVLLTLKLS